MPRPKTTGEKLNCRVELGSALERLLAGRPVTQTLHKMAELVEQAPQAVKAELPAQDFTIATPSGPMRVQMGQPELLPIREGLVIHEGPGTRRPTAAEQARYDETGSPLPLSSQLPKKLREEEFRGGRVFEIGHDDHSRQIVTEQEVLALAREQYPAGLVPIGVDEGDEFDNEELANSATEDVAALAGDTEPDQQDDLSYLA